MSHKRLSQYTVVAGGKSSRIIEFSKGEAEIFARNFIECRLSHSYIKSVGALQDLKGYFSDTKQIKEKLNEQIEKVTDGINEALEKIQKAIKQGTCVLVTEWGLCSSDGTESLNISETDAWSLFMEQNNISWCNYAIGSTFSDEANALYLINEKYSDEQKAAHWPAGLLTKSGIYIKGILLKDIITSDSDSTAETVPDASEV